MMTEVFFFDIFASWYHQIDINREIVNNISEFIRETQIFKTKW